MKQDDQLEERLPLAAHGTENGSPAADGSTTSSVAARLNRRHAVDFTRQWLVIYPDGSSNSVAAHKLAFSHTLGLPLRDLRLLDPQLAGSFPPAILPRPAALAVSLEALKLVITPDRAFLTNLSDPLAAAFAEELCRRLAQGHGDGSEAEGSASNDDSSRQGSKAGLHSSKSLAELGGYAGAAVAGGGVGAQLHLPFELQVLEVALEMVCGRLERLVQELEQAADPALDALAAKVSTGTLERVRAIKGRLVRLTSRVETLKEALERLLDDEDNMRDMNLSARTAELERRATAAPEALPSLPSLVLSAGSPPPAVAGAPGAQAAEQQGGPGPGQEETGQRVLQPRLSMAATQPLLSALSLTRLSTLTYNAGSEASSASSGWEDEAVEVVEALLQSFFFSMDQAWRRLKAMSEHVDDLEDFISIKLDNKRNQLIGVDLLLCSANAASAFVVALTALFAMNLKQSPSWEPDAEGNVQTQGPYWEFVTINVASGLGAVLLITSVYTYAKLKGLLNLGAV